MRRSGFTFIELIFVILIMGFLAKFGVEFLAQAYNNFIFSKVNHSLQAKGEAAVEGIASRLQYRIKDSIIARNPGVEFQALASSDLNESAVVLEWIGMDIDGLRGSSIPNWSGIIDLHNPTTSSALLISPKTNFTSIHNTVDALSDGSSDVNDTAIYFVGSDSNINNYGWDGGALSDHNTSVMHPINITTNDQIISNISGVDFNGTDVFEYYQLAWTAYAVEHNATSGDLTLYYDYQPWNGQTYANGKSALIMENVDTFRFKAIGSIVKIQVCVYTDLMEDYSLCKEKTIY